MYELQSLYFSVIPSDSEEYKEANTVNKIPFGMNLPMSVISRKPGPIKHETKVGPFVYDSSIRTLNTQQATVTLRHVDSPFA